MQLCLCVWRVDVMEMLMLHNAQMHQLVMTLSAGRQQHQQPARPSADELCRLLAVS